VRTRDPRSVQFQARWRGAIDSGDVDLTFRRWRRRQVVAGHRYRTAAGMLEVDEVEEVDPSTLSDADARRAGHADVATLLAGSPGDPSLPLYRVRFHPVAGPDPRDELAHDGLLTADDVAALTARLDRLDRAATDGPWTQETLRLVDAHPEVRAAELAAMVGRETAPFKLDVRKLKNLGLTISLERGYRLSPRGEAYLRARPSH
jgi:hypothetical protein